MQDQPGLLCTCPWAPTTQFRLKATLRVGFLQPTPSSRGKDRNSLTQKGSQKPLEGSTPTTASHPSAPGAFSLFLEIIFRRL